jgi:hypothetical protein
MYEINVTYAGELMYALPQHGVIPGRVPRRE